MYEYEQKKTYGSNCLEVNFNLFLHLVTFEYLIMYVCMYMLFRHKGY